uniref:uncharacterized protein LOC120332325 n=1 Tax=Styela clava TaxID=7725 RepID=UPI00193A98AE|nr:uncharacterized protein LOC120332325 [Styela clava]
MYRPNTADYGDKRYAPIIRPSSASARIQSDAVTITQDVSRPATAAGHAGLTTINKSAEYAQRSRPSSREDKCRLVKQDRRLTLSEIDGIGEHAAELTRLNTPQSTTGKIKVEERITLEQLHAIKAAFEAADTDGSGTLDIDEFKMVVKNSLGIRGRHEEQIIALFMKIDSSSDGEIDWDEFCTYMQLEYAEKEEAFLRSKRVMFTLPAVCSTSHYHKSPVLRMLHIGDSTFMCCSKEGLLSFWSHDMELKKSKMITIDSGGSSSFSIKPSIWVTDISVLASQNKIIIGTGDRDIHFYELSTLDLCCRVTGFDSIPLCMDVCGIDQDECIITYGDDQGCVGIIEIRKCGETFRLWKKAPLINGMPTVIIQEISCESHIYYIKWKVHDDWISKLKYYHELHSVVSSCNQTANALVRGCTRPSTSLNTVPGRGLSAVLSNRQGQASRQGRRHHGRHLPEGKRRQDADQSVFSVYKGVSTFDFCKERNIIATGGMDRILRLWNPYMPQKPTGYLRGHNTPLVFVAMSGVDDRVFSVSVDKVVKVWDLVEQTCLVTLSPKLHKITGEILTCSYTESCKAVAIVTDHISLLKISQKVYVQAEMPTSHSESVTCVGYNSSFNHVITCSEAGVVKLWDFDNGYPMFEFNKAHGDEAVTCMTFDRSGRRLVTGGRDGTIRIWNYNNGHCLRTLAPEGERQEISACLYLETNKNSFICGVGWDKKINIYPDDVQDIRALQRPENKWQNYEKFCHDEDIVCAAHSPPNFLATASYEGLIKVWNFVSGHILCSLPYPGKPSSESDGDSGFENEQVQQAVSKLIFIKKRVEGKVQAPLIAGCTNGTLIFWNVQEREVFAHCAVTLNSCAVTSMVLTEDEDVLYIADELGFIRVWNISQYAHVQSKKRNQLQNPPKLLRGWRCHIKRITSICLVEQHATILTSSTDRTVRIWKLTSEYVGTFGQSNPWDLYDESTWFHPMVPQEVLFDPLSMPDHPILKEHHTVEEVVHEESLEPSDSEEEIEEPNRGVKKQGQFLPILEEDETDKTKLSVEKPSVKAPSRRSSHTVRGIGEDAWRRRLSRRLSRIMLTTPNGINKNEEQNLLNDVRRTMTKSAGKRLRHERLLSQQRHLNLHLDAGSHAFQSLKCFDLKDPSSDISQVYTDKSAGDSVRWNKDNIKEHNEEIQSVTVI